MTNVFVSDVDECESDKGGCQHKCLNTDGSFRCECQEGFKLQTDKKTCEVNNGKMLLHFTYPKLQLLLNGNRPPIPLMVCRRSFFLLFAVFVEFISYFVPSYWYIVSIRARK